MGGCDTDDGRRRYAWRCNLGSLQMKKADMERSEAGRGKELSSVVKVTVVISLWLGLVTGVMHVVLNRNIDYQSDLHREVRETKHLAKLIYDFKHRYQSLQRVLFEYPMYGEEQGLQQVSVINRENKRLIRSMEEYLRSWHGFDLLNRLDDELSVGSSLQKELVRHLMLNDALSSSANYDQWQAHLQRMDKALDNLNAFNLSRLEKATVNVFNYKFEYHKSWSQSAVAFFIIALCMFMYAARALIIPLRFVANRLSVIAGKLQFEQGGLNSGASLSHVGDYMMALEQHIDEITEEEYSEVPFDGVAAANESSFNDDLFNDTFDSNDEQIMPVSTFNCFSDGVLLFDGAGVILYGNESALERLEIHRLTENNRDVSRYIPSLKRWLGVRERDDQFFETALLDSQGKAKPFSARVVSLRVRGQVEDCYVMIFDNQELPEYSDIGENWVHCITQELQPSIDSIKEDLNLLLKCFSAGGRSQIEALVNDASSHADSTVDVIRQMNEVQRIESGDVPFDYSVYSISECLSSVMAQCKLLCDAKNIELVCSVPSADSWVKVDFERIQEVLILLIKNAIMNSGEEGRIEIKLQDMAQRAFLSVVDFGEELIGDNVPGIFYAAQPLSSRADPQRDVVLARCRAIIERHGGKIGFNSAAGERNSIYFNLPISKAGSKLGQAS